MNQYHEVWEKAVEQLRKGIKKDFVLHTEGVVKAMKLLLEKEMGDPDILIPAAMLHDVGWAKVPKKYQCSANKDSLLKAMKLHIEYAPEIIRPILTTLGYKTVVINEITDIVVAHKFCNPTKLSKQLLIDADQLSDAFSEQFYSDVKAYNTTAEKHYNFRIKDNQFYTRTAVEIYTGLMHDRRSEIEKVLSNASPVLLH